MRFLFISFCFCFYFSFGNVGFNYSEERNFSSKDSIDALEATIIWLNYLDNGDYLKSWNLSSVMLKDLVGLDVFSGQMQSVRSHFGDVIDRVFEYCIYAEKLPGAPDGRYFVFTFNVIFEKKEQSLETITPVYEDGEWRVSGYYIK